jgi:L-asparaginase
VYDLRERIRSHDADPSVDGIVVTQGTNTLSESSYFLDLSYDGETPVVFTGAMRNPSMHTADGPMNLLASARVATDPRAAEMGVLVVHNERIHAARDVNKHHTMNLDTFRSAEFGPLGTVDEDRVVWRRRPENPDPTMDPDRDAFRRDVETVTVTMDMSDAQLRACTDRAGLVLGTMGAGHLPETLVDGLRAVRAAGVPVFATSRIPEGRLLRDRYGYAGSEHLLRELDCYYSDLNLHKTRVKAIVALAADRLDDAFERP